MGLFFPEDQSYNEAERQTGFYRYRQVLSTRFAQWWRINQLTLAGFIPLAAGIFYAVASTSILVLLPCSFLGGMVAGPFLAGMYDAILRGLRDESLRRRGCYKRSWKQNWKSSLLPGGLLGLAAGIYTFMFMLFWWRITPPTPGTVALYLFSLLVVLILNMLYWPQLVLFRQKASIRLQNCLLFCIKYFWRVLGAGILQLIYLTLFVLFAPWSILLLPVLGIWYILFLSQFLIYDQMDEAYQIEERYDGDL